MASVTVTRWDGAETLELDRTALLGHDLLVNAVLATRPIPPFARPEDVDDASGRLALICDVTCDVTPEVNVRGSCACDPCQATRGRRRAVGMETACRRWVTGALELVCQLAQRGRNAALLNRLSGRDDGLRTSAGELASTRADERRRREEELAQ